jgi:outer membrane lipoprotein-sorting protein
MRRWTFATALVLITTLPACSTIWAEALSRQMTSALLSMESYHGTLEETGLLPDAPDTAVVRDVWYQKPWRIRSEITQPERLAGSLFLYDGQELILWWPGELTGIRVRGLSNPTRDEIGDHLAREMKSAMDHYAFSRGDEVQLAGHSVDEWRVLPLEEDQPWRMEHTSWNYEPHALPLKMRFQQNGKTWYAYEFTDMAFDVPVPEDVFEFSFPQKALVLEWDMSVPGISMKEARQTMNFPVREPSWLPEGHALQKIVPSSSCLPMVALQFNQGGSVLTLTQSRAFSPDQVPRFGKPVSLGDQQGWLHFAGPYSIVSWTQGDTLLTLMGNLAFPRMLRVARSVR